MGFSTGKAHEVQIDNAATSLTDLSAFSEGVGFEEEGEAMEVTKSGDTSRTYIVGLKNGRFSVQWIVDPTLDAHMNGIINVAGSFQIGPTNTDTGSSKYTGEAICLNYRQTSAVGGVVKATSEFQISGAVTRATYA